MVALSSDKSTGRPYTSGCDAPRLITAHSQACGKRRIRTSRCVVGKNEASGLFRFLGRAGAGTGQNGVALYTSARETNKAEMVCTKATEFTGAGKPESTMQRWRNLPLRSS